MAHRYDTRFQYTLGDLRQCEQAIEGLMNEETERGSHNLLEGAEVKSAHELIQMCGRILNRVFNDSPECEQNLIDFVFRNESGLAEEIIEDKNEIQLVACREQEEELDRIYEAEQKAKGQS